MSFLHLFSTENLITLIQTAGYIGVMAIVFAESGLFIGFFLPGDSLIFTAGFLASQNYLNIWLLIILLLISAVLGDNVGYSFGRKVGPRIFKRESSLLFDKAHLQRANEFYTKYGAKTLILARFMPVIRTFAPIVAGVGKMEYRKFFSFNLIGGALWTITLTLLGYFLGRSIPNIDHYLLPIILLIIILSVLPSLLGLIRSGQLKKIWLKFAGKK